MMADRLLGSPNLCPETFCITGARGKTSVAHALAQVLAVEMPCGVIATVGHGFPGDLKTTGDPADRGIRATLEGLCLRGARAVAVEVSFEALARSRADDVCFTHALFTGLDGADPREAGASLDRAEAVLRLFRSPDLKRAVLVGLIGAFNAANLLAVLAMLLERGLPLERAARESSRIQCVPGRMECFGDAQTPLIVVDEARTPAALETALVNLRKHGPRRIFTVFGCGGERDPGVRPVMGAIAERLSDELILADDNPRGECGETIIADILAGVVDPGRVRVRRRRALAIRTAIALAGIGDAVLVAGKGHETIQEMGELKIRFSDRAQVVEALREWQEGRR